MADYKRIMPPDRSPNLIGLTFGHLTVIGVIRPPKRWICRCDCGNDRYLTRTSNLHKLGTPSCGCRRYETVAAALTKHGDNRGHCRAKEYRTWHHMIERCTDKNNKDAHHYSGRGITVCDRWLTYSSFLEDMGRAPTPKHSIERIDNGGNYEPGNCRWATQAEQTRNTRRTVFIDGVPLVDACAARGISYGTGSRWVRMTGKLDPPPRSWAHIDINRVRPVRQKVRKP